MKKIIPGKFEKFLDLIYNKFDKSDIAYRDDSSDGKTIIESHAIRWLKASRQSAQLPQAGTP